MSCKYYHNLSYIRTEFESIFTIAFKVKTVKTFNPIFCSSSDSEVMKSIFSFLLVIYDSEKSF